MAKLKSPFQSIKQPAAGHRYTRLSKGLERQRGKRNETESAYETHVLLPAKLSGDVLDWWFEPFTVRLSHPESGQPARYTPDFMILSADGTTYIDDTKGAGPDDAAAIVRLKCAAELFPLWVWRLAKRQRDGAFKVTTV